VMAIPGARSETRVVFVGGLDTVLAERIAGALGSRGFEVRAHAILVGLEPLNLCNRGRSGAGVQLELSRGLRRGCFRSLDAAGRRHPTRAFGLLVEALCAGL